MLVLINLGKEKISDYKLSLKGTSIQDGTFQLETILGEGTANPVTITASELTPFQPLAVLEPYSTTIFIIK